MRIRGAWPVTTADAVFCKDVRGEVLGADVIQPGEGPFAERGFSLHPFSPPSVTAYMLRKQKRGSRSLTEQNRHCEV